MRPALLLVLALATLGCGGSTQPAQPQAATPATAAPATKPASPGPIITSRADFIEHADAVCADLHRRLKPWQVKADKAKTLPEIAIPAEHIRPLAAEMARRLSALRFPRDGGAAAHRYVALVRRQARDIDRIATAASGGDMAEVLRLGQQNGQYIDRQRGIAEGLGMKVCGRANS
jgi:hypothetical protein